MPATFQHVKSAPHQYVVIVYPPRWGEQFSPAGYQIKVATLRHFVAQVVCRKRAAFRVFEGIVANRGTLANRIGRDIGDL